MSEPITFTGTVVSCETRFDTKAKIATLVDFDSRWVVTIDVDAADPEAPGPAGERVSLLIHSPVQVFHAAASELTGWRCQLTIERKVVDGRTSWSNLTAKRLD